MRVTQVMASLAMLCSLCSSQSLAAPIGPTGPDGYGHRGTDIPYNLRDISSTGTFLPLSDDVTSGSIPLGFTFNFYGVNYTSVYISSNGFIDLDNQGPNGCCTGQPLPQADSVNGIIAGFWEDIDPGNGGAPAENNVRYQTVGTPGNREFIVGFYNVDHYPNGTNVTFEMILHETSNNMEFQYLDAATDGGTHSIGIERPDGLDGLQVLLQASNTPPLPLVTQGYLIYVPEPASLLLVAIAAAVGAVYRKR